MESISEWGSDLPIICELFSALDRQGFSEIAGRSGANPIPTCPQKVAIEKREVA
jgi:hypothetical protein